MNDFKNIIIIIRPDTFILQKPEILKLFFAYHSCVLKTDHVLLLIKKQNFQNVNTYYCTIIIFKNNNLGTFNSILYLVGSSIVPIFTKHNIILDLFQAQVKKNQSNNCPYQAAFRVPPRIFLQFCVQPVVRLLQFFGKNYKLKTYFVVGTYRKYAYRFLNCRLIIFLKKIFFKKYEKNS